jgi:hypothetical protein
VASHEPISSPTWEYVPGLLELIDEGLEPGDLATREFVAPQVRSSGLAGKDLTPAEVSRLERVWNWLRGFRRDGTLIEREPIWVPLARVWAAPQGKAEFTYTSAAETERRAEITVFSAAGLGGASKRKLSSAVKLSAAQSGAAYDTRASLTVHKYVKAATGEVIYRVDVDCNGEVGEFRSRDLPSSEHPFAKAAPTEAELRQQGFVVSRLERCADRSESTDVTLKDETIGSWKFDIASKIPAIPLPFKLGATCQNTKAFETKFTLPGGHDYAFCAAKGERPLAPMCVTLAAS